MDAISIAAFLTKQSKQYQTQSTKRQKISNALSYQNNIRCYKTIPKQYLPPSFPTMPSGDSKLQTEFSQRYNELFFEYLCHVITHNEISLTLVESHMKQIVSHTEEIIAMAKIPTELKASHYKTFISNNDVPDHIVNSSLKALLPTTATQPTKNPGTGKHTRKRKQHQRTQPKKRPRKANISDTSADLPQTTTSRVTEDHFLYQCPKANQPPI